MNSFTPKNILYVCLCKDALTLKFQLQALSEIFFLWKFQGTCRIRIQMSGSATMINSWENREISRFAMKRLQFLTIGNISKKKLQIVLHKQLSKMRLACRIFKVTGSLDLANDYYPQKTLRLFVDSRCAIRDVFLFECRLWIKWNIGTQILIVECTISRDTSTEYGTILEETSFKTIRNYGNVQLSFLEKSLEVIENFLQIVNKKNQQLPVFKC